MTDAQKLTTTTTVYIAYSLPRFFLNFLWPKRQYNISPGCLN